MVCDKDPHTSHMFSINEKTNAACFRAQEQWTLQGVLGGAQPGLPADSKSEERVFQSREAT